LRQVANPSVGRVLQSQGSFARVIEPLAPAITPKSSEERDKITNNLIHAGFRWPSAIAVFYAVKVMIGVASPVLMYLSMPFINHYFSPERAFSSLTVLTMVIAASALGMFVPNFVLNRLVTKRQDAIQKGFPDALDLLVVAVEAGMGLSAAMERVGNELVISHPDLSDELRVVNAEVLAGIDRGVALRNLAKRTGVEEVQVFCGLISQTIKLGTGVADTLRIFAEEFRDRRIQRAEEQAAKIGLKLIFPLILCMLPAVFVVLVGPAGIILARVFRQMSGQ
jgi:tight adherence protein C